MAVEFGCDALHVLRRRFDERLAWLQAEDASDRLRALMLGSTELGKVTAGECTEDVVKAADSD